MNSKDSWNPAMKTLPMSICKKAWIDFDIKSTVNSSSEDFLMEKAIKFFVM